MMSNEESRITFDNQTGETVRCCWLDFSGAEVPYSVIQPDARPVVYKTWVGHFWVVREVESEQRVTMRTATVTETTSMGTNAGASAGAGTDRHRIVTRTDTVREVCVGQISPQHYILEPPATPSPYHERSHNLFPVALRQEARALLLAHYLSWQSMGAPGGDGNGDRDATGGVDPPPRPSGTGTGTGTGSGTGAGGADFTVVRSR